MSIFKRLSATLISQVDNVVSEIENHDAVVEAALRDSQRAMAKAKIRFNRLRADGRRLEQRLEQLIADETRWTERAKSQSKQDEDIALQCLQKRRDCRQQIDRVKAALNEHRTMESRLTKELEVMEGKVNDITQQKNLLRTRQSAADAMRTFKAIEEGDHIDIDSVFERWEVRIAEAELATGNIECSDTLEQKFIDAEEKQNLKSELEELTRGEEQ